MKFWQSTALAALAVGIAAPAFAAGGTVSYVCQQGKQVDVSYQFNSRGKPVSALARLNGSNRNMAFDARRSDSTGTAFKDRAGYNLTGPVLTASNYRSEEGISILSPRSEFLYKDCNPRQNEPARQAPPASARSGSVAYVCQQGRRLNVNYHFNSAGVPTSAELRVNNRNLRTFEVSLEQTLRLLPALSGHIVVTESGIRSKADVDFMRGHGVETFLIGESFMRADDIEAAVRVLF